MDLRLIFPNNKTKGEDSGFDVKTYDEDFLQDLYNKAEKDYEENRKWKYDTFRLAYIGDQWNARLKLLPKLRTGNLIDEEGNPLWDIGSMEANKENRKPRPLRIYNLLKPNLDTQAALYAEVDPKPVVVPKNYSAKVDQNFKEMQLVLDEVFEEENKFTKMYYGLNLYAMIYGEIFVNIVVDRSNSVSNVPIKFRYVDPNFVYVDPNAISLNEAEYIIVKVKMPYYKLKAMGFYYTGDSEKENKPMDECDVKKWWIKANGQKNKRSNFICFFEYEGAILVSEKPEDESQEQGETAAMLKKLDKIKDHDYRVFPVYEKLPMICWRTKIYCDTWNGESKLDGAIEPQYEINKCKTEQAWAFAKAVDAPWITTGVIDQSKITNGDVPGGRINKEANEQMQKVDYDLANQGSFDARIQQLAAELTTLMGDVNLLTGRKPGGVYSDKLLQSMVKLNQLRQANTEDCFLFTEVELAEKTLYIFSRNIKSATIFDSSAGKSVHVKAANMTNAMAKIDIKTMDANLMSPEAKLAMLKELMQYGDFQELLGGGFFVGKLMNAYMPGIIPEEIMKELEAKIGGKAMVSSMEAQPGDEEQPGPDSITEEQLRAFVEDEFNKGVEAFKGQGKSEQQAISELVMPVLAAVGFDQAGMGDNPNETLADYIDGNAERPDAGGIPAEDILMMVQKAVAEVAGISANN